MAIEFTQGAWLWLLAAIPLLWFWPVRLTDHRQGVLRGLALALVVFGLARPTIPGGEVPAHQVIVWDTSLSGDAAGSVTDLFALRKRIDEARTTLVTLSSAPAPSERELAVG